MGDYFQTIVDLDATAADAGELAARVLGWFVREEIVRAEQNGHGLASQPGNPPGDQWAKAVVTPDREPTGCLAIKSERTVFWSGQGGAQYAQCPRCAGRTWFYTEDWHEIDGAFAAFGRAMDVWYATGAAGVTCPLCAQTSDLETWEWADDYFVFGYLGFEFWNWPEIAPRFVADLARILVDHRVVRIGGKL